MKLSVLVNSSPALAALASQNLPINIGWKLKLFISKINPEIKAYEEIRVSKVQAYGIEDEKEKGKFTVKQENILAFQQEIFEILDKEVEVDIPDIKMQDIIEYSEKQNKPIEISVGDMMILDWLLK